MLSCIIIVTSICNHTILVGRDVTTMSGTHDGDQGGTAGDMVHHRHGGVEGCEGVMGVGLVCRGLGVGWNCIVGRPRRQDLVKCSDISFNIDLPYLSIIIIIMLK